MSRAAFAIGLLWLSSASLLSAQNSEVPGLPEDPAAAEPPPRVQPESPVPPEPAPSESAADAEAEGEPVPQPPVLPEPMESGQPIEPDVTIIQRDDATIEEYRHNGRLYMVKVTPSVGKPYYLVDRDGDGQMEARMSEIYDDMVIPQWVIFSW